MKPSVLAVQRMRPLARLVCVALIVGTSPACLGPRASRAPRASAPYSVRLLGASDGALRGTIRHGQPAFAGSAGRDFAIEVTNDTAGKVGFSIVLDGLDAMTGEPTESCTRLGMWMLRAGGSTRVRGFSLSETRIATYRFAHPAQALAAIAKGGHPNAIGTIDVCFFSLKPAPPDEEEGAYGFRAIIESDAAGQAPPVAGELRDQPVSAHGPDLAPDKLLSHVVITYEDEDGAPLGTAPPPAGIARVAPSRRDEPPAREPDLAPMDDDTTPKPHKPPKSPPKSPPKPDRRPIKTDKPDKG